jgi:peptidoglycan hydrolase-like protein with peptidoglycan-binding domain
MSTAPRRSKYFSGQLLTAEDFEAEQFYFLDRRRSDNRRLHGWGVVCGLRVTPSGKGGVVVQPGLAIDGLGREIVVPAPQEMPDPRQPIDHRGEPCGERVDCEVITICLAYAECAENDGDHARFVREMCTLRVRPGPPEPPPGNPAAEAVLTESRDEVARALCEAAAGDACDPAERSVPIATVDARKGAVRVAPCPRPTVVSTDGLRAVKEFQRNNGLADDGVVGPKTWMALEEAFTSRRSERRPECGCVPSSRKGGVQHGLFRVALQQ